MPLLLASLTFFPLLVLTLILHELGHFLAAKALGIPVQSFQVGLGWTLARRHSGRQAFALAPALQRLSDEPPGPGRIVTLFYRPGPEPPRRRPPWPFSRGKPPGPKAPPPRTAAETEKEPRPQATALLVYPQNNKLTPEQRAALLRRYQQAPAVTGRLIAWNAAAGTAVLAPMEWRLKAAPIAAFITLQEDAAGQLPRSWKSSSLKNQLLLIFAGPALNLLAAALIIAFLDLMPPQGVNHPVLTVHHVAENSPAWHSGLRPGQRILQVDKGIVLPTEDRLNEILAENGLNAAPTHLTVRQVNGDTATLKVEAQRLEGAALGPGPPPRDARQQFQGADYAAAPAPEPLESTAWETMSRNISGPLLGAALTAQLVQYASWRGWLAILAAVNITMALSNLLPLPPLDGWQIVLAVTRKLRRGKEMSPAVQARLVLCGIGILATISLLLFLSDLRDVFR